MRGRRLKSILIIIVIAIASSELLVYAKERAGAVSSVIDLHRAMIATGVMVLCGGIIFLIRNRKVISARMRWRHE